MEYALVGKIIGTHGIKGELKVKSETSFPEKRYQIGSKLYLDIEGKKQNIIISSHRIHKGLDLIKINNYNNINDVLGFVGKEILIDIDSLEELDEGQYYYSQLIGIKCYNSKKELIGEITDIREVPQGEILEITKLDEKKALVPFVDEFIKDVDINKKIVVINEIEGLL